MFRTAATIALATLVLSSWTGASAKPAAKPAARKPAAQAGAKPRTAAPANNNNAALTAAFNAYCDSLRNRLDKGWNVADGTNKVTLTADVDKDGTVTNLNIKSSPSNTTAEQAASDAFNSAQPLSALPSNVQSIKLTLSFESTADPHGDSSRNIGTRIDNIILPGTTPAATTPPATESGGGN